MSSSLAAQMALDWRVQLPSLKQGAFYLIMGYPLFTQTHCALLFETDPPSAYVTLADINTSAGEAAAKDLTAKGYQSVPSLSSSPSKTLAPN